MSLSPFCCTALYLKKKLALWRNFRSIFAEKKMSCPDFFLLLSLQLVPAPNSNVVLCACAPCLEVEPLAAAGWALDLEGCGTVRLLHVIDQHGQWDPNLALGQHAVDQPMLAVSFVHLNGRLLGLLAWRNNGPHPWIWQDFWIKSPNLRVPWESSFCKSFENESPSWYMTIGRAHCSNPKVRIRKKMQPKSETVVRTSMKRASKRAPTWYSWPLASRSLWP